MDRSCLYFLVWVSFRSFSTVCIWRCEHARFCVEVLYALYINFHLFIHSKQSCWHDSSFPDGSCVRPQSQTVRAEVVGMLHCACAVPWVRVAGRGEADGAFRHTHPPHHLESSVRTRYAEDQDQLQGDGAKVSPSSPFLIGRSVCSPNILRTVRRTMIHFLMELLVRRSWFGQFDELYFVLN